MGLYTNLIYSPVLTHPGIKKTLSWIAYTCFIYQANTETEGTRRGRELWLWFCLMLDISSTLGSPWVDGKDLSDHSLGPERSSVTNWIPDCQDAKSLGFISSLIKWWQPHHIPSQRAGRRRNNCKQSIYSTTCTHQLLHGSSFVIVIIIVTLL